MGDVTLDRDAVRSWFARLYGDMDATEMINIVPVRNDWSGVTGSCWEIDSMIKLIEKLDSGHPAGIYHRITTVTTPPAPFTRGEAVDSHLLPGFWADIDIAGPGHKSKTGTLPADEQAARKIVSNSALPEPTLWVHSGGGLYPWWLLDRPAEVTTDSYASIAALSNELHAELKRSAEELGMSYEPMADLARVLRIPGTVNRKVKDDPRPCQVIEDSGVTYSIEAVRDAVPGGTALTLPTPPAGPVDVLAGLPAGPACRAMDLKLSKVSDALRDAETGSRHRTALSGIGALVWLGNVGHMGARDALDSLGEIFEQAKPKVEQGRDEWRGLVDYVIKRTEPRETRRCCGEWAFTEAHMSERVAEEVLVGAFRWSGGTAWMQWTGKVWRRVEDAVVSQVVKEWIMDGFRRANLAFGASPEKGTEAVMKGWRSLLSANAIKNVIKLAQGIDGILFDAAELDADPDLLNCPNGVVDLRTGVLLDHDPARLISKIAGVDYDPKASHPDTVKILSALPDEVRDWMQVRIGQAATGHMTPDDLLCVLQGSGQNAKSTLLEGVSHALGSYHAIVSDRVIMGDITRDEIMVLQGARSAWLEETPEAAHLDVVKLKKIVGTSEITGHHLYKSQITWRASHSLFITTNYVPMVSESDHGTWRRLALVKFPYTFVREPVHENERQTDPTLRDRIKRTPEVMRAFLAWIVDGAKAYYAAGQVMPEMPERVRADTDHWRADVDLIMGYWRDRIEHDPTRYVLTTDLRRDFNEWAETKGHRALSERVFDARFSDHTKTKAARVRKERIRTTTEGISRPETAKGGVPEKAMTWSGVRFTEDEDPFR